MPVNRNNFQSKCQTTKCCRWHLQVVNFQKLWKQCEVQAPWLRDQRQMSMLPMSTCGAQTKMGSWDRMRTKSSLQCRDLAPSRGLALSRKWVVEILTRRSWRVRACSTLAAATREVSWDWRTLQWMRWSHPLSWTSSSAMMSAVPIALRSQLPPRDSRFHGELIVMGLLVLAKWQLPISQCPYSL